MSQTPGHCPGLSVSKLAVYGFDETDNETPGHILGLSETNNFLVLMTIIYFSDSSGSGLKSASLISQLSYPPARPPPPVPPPPASYSPSPPPPPPSRTSASGFKPAPPLKSSQSEVRRNTTVLTRVGDFVTSTSHGGCFDMFEMVIRATTSSKS